MAEDAGRQFRAEIRGPAPVRGDPELLTQMLANLVENALVHTPEGSPIELAAGLRDDRAVVSIADRGPGIPMADRARVLERQGVTLEPEVVVWRRSRA